MPAFIANLGARERLALAGGALAIVGGLVVVAVAGSNANGVAGPEIVVVLGAAIAAAAVLVRRGRQELVSALAAGVLLVAIVEAIPPIRYSADLDAFGGILGAVARAVALAGAVALLVGVAGRIDPRRLLPAADESAGRLPALLVLAGSGVLVVGWLALVGLGVGFAPRVIDGLAIVAACLAVATTRIAAIQGPAVIRLALRLAPVVLSAAVAIVTLGSVLAVGDRFGDLLGSGPASLVAYLVYLASAIPLVAAVVLVVRPLVRTGRS